MFFVLPVQEINLPPEKAKEVLLHLCFAELIILSIRSKHSNVADKIYDEVIANGKKVEQQSKEKETFFACMSHEIRNPIQSLVGSIELLIPLVSQVEQAKNIASIIKNCCEMVLNLVNNILDISKIQAGKMEYSPAPCDPRETVNQVIKIMQGKAQGKGLDLKFAVNYNVPPALEIDSARLNQVVLNLLSNAIKFTRQGEVSVQLTWVDSPLLEQPSFSTNDFSFEETAHNRLAPYFSQYTPSSI